MISVSNTLKTSKYAQKLNSNVVYEFIVNSYEHFNFRKIRSRDPGSGDEQYFSIVTKASENLLSWKQTLFFLLEFRGVSYGNANSLWSWKTS